MDQPTTGQWNLDGRRSAGMSLVAVVASVVGIGFFGWLGSLFGPSAVITTSARPEEASRAIWILVGVLVGMVALTVVLFLLHEWCHGLALRMFGARPKYGAKLVSGFFPILYASAPGYWLTQGQYLKYVLAPTVVLNAVCLPLLFTPIWWAAVLPMATHLGGCAGDWWIAWVVTGFPRDTLFEDTQDGFQYRRVSVALSSPQPDHRSESPQ